MPERGSAPGDIRLLDGVLIGRVETRAALAGCLADVQSGRCTEGVVLCGLLQSGRTMLLEWAARLARSSGWLTVELTAGQGQAQLWAAAATLADVLGARRPGSLAVRALHDAMAAPSPSLAVACRTFARLAAEAADECRTHVLVLIDDIDRWGWEADAALSQLSEPASRGMPLLVLAAGLPGVHGADAAAVHNLGPLTVAELVAEPEIELDPVSAQRLVEATGGWPGAVATLLGSRPEDWSVEGHEFFEQITAGLDADELRCVEAVCSAGDGPVPLGHVATALERGARVRDASMNLEVVCDRLVERGVLYRRADGRLDIGVGGYRLHLSSSRRR